VALAYAYALPISQTPSGYIFGHTMLYFYVCYCCRASVIVMPCTPIPCLSPISCLQSPGVVPAFIISIDFSYGPADCASQDWNGQLITLVSASLTKQTSDNGLGLMESREVYYNVSGCHGTTTQNGKYTGTT
jgi:hypothetical protein